MISVRRVESKSEIKKFARLPYFINADDSIYASDLVSNFYKLINPSINPFFKHATVYYYVAFKAERPVGRIVLIINGNYQKLNGADIGQFGFFDSIDDQEVAKALFDTIVKDAKNIGLSQLIGPTNFSFNDSIGVLVNGFDHPPFYEMPHNKPYYANLFETYGCVKDQDLLAYHIESKRFPDRFIKAAPVLLNRFKSRGISVRKINMADFDQDVESMMNVYNSAWVVNQGFVPAEPEEFQFYFKKYKPFLDPDLIFLACHEEKVIGFLLCLPNMNEVYSKYSMGEISFFKKLFNPVKSEGIKTLRIVAIGVEKGYRTLGIDSYFMSKMVETARRKGYVAGEASRILETNEALINAMHKMDALEYKRYRLYRLKL